MPEVRTIRSRAEMSEQYFDTLTRMIRSQAYRELAAAHQAMAAVIVALWVAAAHHVRHVRG